MTMQYQNGFIKTMWFLTQISVKCHFLTIRFKIKNRTEEKILGIVIYIILG